MHKQEIKVCEKKRKMADFEIENDIKHYQNPSKKAKCDANKELEAIKIENKITKFV